MERVPYPASDEKLVKYDDPLTAMMRAQKAFQLRVDPRCYSGELKERADYIRDHFTHCVQELGEMLQEVPFYKGWKDYSNMSDYDVACAYTKAKEEYIDAWHFFMNIGIALGISPDKFFDLYNIKHQENIRRQDEGYTQ